MILESTERALVEDLLRLSIIYDEYNSRSAVWISFIKDVAEKTKGFLDANGHPVKFTPKEVIRIILPFLYPANLELLSIIRQLEFDENYDIRDLYIRLSRLEIPTLTSSDHKGLFLLSAKAAEDNGTF